jgi:phasin
MTETKTPKKAAKAAATPAAETAFAVPSFELPTFELPKVEAFEKLEVPAVVRDMAEKSVAQAKVNFEKAKGAFEDATDVIEDTYEVSRSAAIELNLKALDALKTNSDALFGFYKDFLAVKTVSEAVELQTAFARKSFDTLAAQAKDMQALVEKVANEATKPVKDAVAKVMAEAKAA